MAEANCSALAADACYRKVGGRCEGVGRVSQLSGGNEEGSVLLIKVESRVPPPSVPSSAGPLPLGLGGSWRTAKASSRSPAFCPECHLVYVRSPVGKGKLQALMANAFNDVSRKHGGRSIAN